MFESGLGGQLSAAVVYAMFIGLWGVLPGLLAGCIRRSIAVRRICPKFSLRKSEALELGRAVLLYEKVYQRIKEIGDRREAGERSWRTFFYRPADVSERCADELEDLTAHTRHLRAVIILLKGRPLQRLRSSVHIRSSRFALVGALATYMLVFALQIIAFGVLWPIQLTVADKNPTIWYPLDGSIFYANVVAAGFAAITLPVFYLIRLASLRQAYWLEFNTLKQFAALDPGQLIDQSEIDREPRPKDASEIGESSSWFAVLGLSPSATIKEVKEAYKARIRQNHPDRVHDMAPAFRHLAEVETKKLNAAYQHALFCIPSLESRRSAVAN